MAAYSVLVTVMLSVAMVVAAVARQVAVGEATAVVAGMETTKVVVVDDLGLVEELMQSFPLQNPRCLSARLPFRLAKRHRSNGQAPETGYLHSLLWSVR